VIAGLAALALAEAPPPAATPSAPAVSTTTLDRVEGALDVCVEKNVVGRMTYRVMTVSGISIIDEDLEATLDGKEIAFTSQQVFRGQDAPVPTKAKATARLGTHKTMDGTLAFNESGGSLAAKVVINGFVDPKGNLYTTPVTEAKDVSLASSTVLSHAALIFFASRMLPATGQKDKIVWMDLPAWVEYPNLVNFRQACTLVRKAPAADGSVVFSIKQSFAGGNEEFLAIMTLDKAGKVTELRLPKFTLRPHKIEVPGKAADSKTAPGK
jgi:hypothetical protein